MIEICGTGIAVAIVIGSMAWMIWELNNAPIIDDVSSDYFVRFYEQRRDKDEDK